ncbi:hypothetical protein [Caballeronia sp. RCC_10]|uniref:hypothetical protein n=1 Tax=Caballeronia sp. RCC_10 TaxID=3239227 RepID=UPI0035258952
MSMLIQLIRDSAAAFDSWAYPPEVYYSVLARVRNACTPIELGEALCQALAWKDGKVRLDPDGPYTAAPSNIRFRTETTKPNTLCDEHREILSSREFFDWASNVREMRHFDISRIHDLDQRFGLWASAVIPAFVLHCLRPEVYPMVDRWVLTAYNLLSGNPEHPLDIQYRTSIGAYQRYQEWWLNVLSEAGLGSFSSQLNQLKEIDAGLWALGKRAAAIAKELVAVGESERPDVAVEDARSEPGTESERFKLRAIALRRSGKTQRQAMKDAAADLGITLKPSYLNYPGSHFERWRKQGLE